MSEITPSIALLPGIFGVVSCVAMLGCGSAHSAAAVPELTEIGTSPAQQVQEVEVPGRPSAVLIARHGDPAGAVALAFATPDGGVTQAATITALLRARLEAAGYGLLKGGSLPTGGYVAALTREPDDARAVVETIDSALNDVVTGKEGWLDTLAAPPTVAASVAQQGDDIPAVSCWPISSPDRASAALARPRSRAGVQQLNTWRVAIRQSSRVRFGAAGDPEHLEAVQGAIESLETWPPGSPIEPRWPTADVFTVAPAMGGPSQLAIAVRLRTAAAALDAARVLAEPGSALSTQLAGAGHAWRLDTVSGEAELAGGCVHIQLRPSATGTELPTNDVARAARIAVDEVQRAPTNLEDVRWATATAILQADDPRRAAAAAAWQALSVSVDHPTRASVTWYADENVRMSRHDLERAYAQFDAYWDSPKLEAKVREEPGQGELWVLLGTPCGTGVEGPSDAGLGALAMSTAARASDGRMGVTLEPWVAPDGLGLVAHAARRGNGESAEQLAERVAEALGRSLVTRDSTTTAFLDTKRAGLALVGPQQRPGYWAALEALSPGHPSWLLPEGTWDALSGADMARAGARLRMLLSGPLRVATLTNANAEQSEVVRLTLARWLRPYRAEPRRCPVSSAPTPPRWGRTRVDAVGETERATGYVGITLPTYDAPLDDEARYTTWLLNRRGGWLEKALTRSHLASWANARLLGGPRAAAILVEVAAQPEEQQAAVMQVRALFGRLASGAVSEADVVAARRYFAEAELLSALDPRHRIVRLWRDQPGSKAELSTLDLRRFHRQAFSADRVVVVELANEPQSPP